MRSRWVSETVSKSRATSYRTLGRINCFGILVGRTSKRVHNIPPMGSPEEVALFPAFKFSVDLGMELAVDIGGGWGLGLGFVSCTSNTKLRDPGHVDFRPWVPGNSRTVPFFITHRKLSGTEPTMFSPRKMLRQTLLGGREIERSGAELGMPKARGGRERAVRWLIRSRVVMR